MSEPTAAMLADALVREVFTCLYISVDVEWTLQAGTNEVAPAHVSMTWDHFKQLAVQALLTVQPAPEQTPLDLGGSIEDTLVRYSRRVQDWQLLTNERLTRLEDQLRELQAPEVRTDPYTDYTAGPQAVAEGGDLPRRAGAAGADALRRSGVPSTAFARSIKSYVEHLEGLAGRGTYRDPADAQVDEDGEPVTQTFSSAHDPSRCSNGHCTCPCRECVDWQLYKRNLR